MAFFWLTHLGSGSITGCQPPGQRAASSQTAAPKQTQRLPATAAQQFGWWLLQDLKCKAESVHPWIVAQRYPHINTPCQR
ncbi:hypothetical protein XELAEV_18013301mg, partial [Xenopus laevis]